MSSIESILSTIRESGLPSILPSLALCQRDHGLAAVPITEPKLNRSVGLLWLRGAQRRAAAQVFAAVAEQALAERKRAVNGVANKRVATQRPLARATAQ